MHKGNMHLSLLLRSTLFKKPLWKRQVCPEFINRTIENNLSHKSGDKSTLYNVAMNVFLLLLHIFICAWPFCFAETWCLSATSMCLSVSSNEPGIKSETFGVMWHVFLVMANVLVEIFVTVHNWRIGFWILEQRATWHQRFQILF